ncbi:hypothetical protein [Rahnella laticis]|uniref:gp53-like domain-containing protein n=1 Tax=Rahnella laticis TaxID=2787622 RepID=UPI0018A2C370|nr:hypothetical protein [Rahnella laticis]MBF7994087.1 hypothetical protein [Rahnella laticis]
MANNNFKAFGISNGANVTNQADYEALAALLSGFTAGKASSAQVNKALRQGTVMASVLAQFIANTTTLDVLDNGDTATLLTNLLAALKTNGAGSFLQITNNLSEIAAAGSAAQAAAQAALALGNAALRTVGTSTGRIPDMSSFLLGSMAAGGQGGFKTPTGHIVQYGGGTTGAVSGGFTQNYTVPFPTQTLHIVPVVYATLGVARIATASTSSRTSANINVVDINGNGVAGQAVGYISIGY